ncbi:response regulator transcription factor [Nocardia acidivorans]|uniref:response regulator transcription factor n=1 Tax=Nocardia acidivorans TaxID=404580 RepID=UPI000ACF6484|nr:response regulator transcription factor [Nocardia acidivorans]
MPDDRMTTRSLWILVCEDDDDLGDRVAAGLREAGFLVDLTRNLAEARRSCGERRYDCLIVDRGLPDGDGLELVRRQRDSKQRTPALVITARDSPLDRTEGYASGADDYLAKPFSLSELAARVRALCGRRPRSPAPVLTVGDLVVDRLRRRVQRNGVLLIMTSPEFCALELLAARAGTMVSRTEIAEYCGATPSSANVEDVIHRLDRKLGEPQLIHPAGRGYLLHL